MATVYRVRALWSGFPGAPGYTNFSYADLTTDALRNAAGASVRTFFTGISAYLNNAWSIQVQPEVTEYDMVSGQLTGATLMTSVPSVQIGTGGTAVYAGGSGMCVTWKTGVIYNGRRVIGRTFIVPAVSCYETDGTLLAAAQTALTSAATGLISNVGTELCVWAKTFTKPTDDTKPVQIGGLLPPVVATSVKDMASQLRSRRI